MSDIKKISPLLKPHIQNIHPISTDAAVSLQNSYIGETSSTTNTSGQRRSIAEAQVIINNAILHSAQDVEALKKQLGIENFPAEKRLYFYFQSVIPRGSSDPRLTKLKGIIVYEMNGLSLTDIYNSLYLLVSSGLQYLIQLKNAAEIFPGVGKNSRIFSILTTIIEYQQQDDLSRILHPGVPASSNTKTSAANLTEQSENEKLIVMWNRAKFIAIQNVILSSVNQEKLFYSDQPSYFGAPDKDPFPQTTADVELTRFIWNELSSEGSCASINIWDSAIFTWGRGFAGKGGGLGSLLSRLYNIPHIRHLFQAIGISVDVPKALSILTEDGWKTAPNIAPDSWQYIKNNKALILFFIALGEIEKMPLPLNATHTHYRQTVSDAQLAEIVNTNGIFQVPAAQLENWKADFGYDSAAQQWPAGSGQENNYKKFILLNAHIFHWMPVFGMTGPANILKNKNGVYYKASVRNTLLQFANRAAADPINYAWTDIGIINNNEQEKILYSSLLKTKPISFATLIMDRGHFLGYGGDLDQIKKMRINSPVEIDINRGLADGSVIEFSRIELIAPGQQNLGYQIYVRQRDGGVSVLKLNQKKFQGAAIYYIFEKNVVKKGYVITHP